MLDKYIVPKTRPVLQYMAVGLYERGIRADAVTTAGFFVGMAATVSVAYGHTWLALAGLLLNRLADGLDGELARLEQPTAAGGFLDITLDFIFYAVFPLGFALYNPSDNALAAALLIASFVGTGASFLAFATQADKCGIVDTDFQYKGFYYLNGLAEGTETIAFFVLVCVFPDSFRYLAWAFTTVCVITAANRVFFGYRTLKKSSSRV